MSDFASAFKVGKGEQGGRRERDLIRDCEIVVRERGKREREKREGKERESV